LIKVIVSQQPFEMGNLSTALLGFRFSCTRIISFLVEIFLGLGGRKENPGIYEKDKAINGSEIILHLIKRQIIQMTTIIIEDENKARLLQRKLDKLNIEVAVMLHSVSEAIDWFSKMNILI
jgi:hypothetical protein